ncbi:MAG: hypothetical protein IT290_03995 [Deltaproteobacteria bacterium]|nr:hypothetical protein [Deltaproteobacteria bacterium]
MRALMASWFATATTTYRGKGAIGQVSALRSRGQFLLADTLLVECIARGIATCDSLEELANIACCESQNCYALADRLLRGLDTPLEVPLSQAILTMLATPTASRPVFVNILEGVLLSRQEAREVILRHTTTTTHELGALSLLSRFVYRRTQDARLRLQRVWATLVVYLSSESELNRQLALRLLLPFARVFRANTELVSAVRQCGDHGSLETRTLVTVFLLRAVGGQEIFVRGIVLALNGCPQVRPSYERVLRAMLTNSQETRCAEEILAAEFQRMTDQELLPFASGCEIARVASARLNTGRQSSEDLAFELAERLVHIASSRAAAS